MSVKVLSVVENTSAEKLQLFMEIKHRTDVPAYIEERIYEVYRTTAVTAIDVLSLACNNSRLRLDLYQQPLWAIAVQIDEPVVADAVEKCLQQWEVNNYANNFVDTYLLQLGILPENLESEKAKLLTQLPDALRYEKSPDVYKLFRAVELMSRQHEDVNSHIFRDEDSSSTYIAGMLNYEEEKLPIKLANAVASDDVAVVAHAGGITGVVGAAIGKAVNLKYNLADSYEQAMRDSMGEYAERYDQDKQLAKEKRELVRAQRQEEQRAHKEFVREEKRIDKQYARGNERIRTLNEAQAAKGWVNTPTTQVTSKATTFDGNFAPSVSTWLIACGANMLLIIIIALVMGWGKAVLPGIGLLIATFGFIQQKAKEPKYMQTIVAGYIVAAFAIIFI